MDIDFNSFQEAETPIQPNNIFYDFCVDAIYRNTNSDEYMIVAITGKPGSGKSTLAIAAAVYARKYSYLRYRIEAPFGIENIFLETYNKTEKDDPSTFFGALSSRTNIKNNIFILDDPNIGIYMTTENQKLNDFFRTARTHNILIIITLPSTRDLPLITVQNYLKVVFFIKERRKNNLVILKPKKPIFQSDRSSFNSKKSQKEMQLATAGDLMISKVRINSFPFTIPPDTPIRSIAVPSLTNKSEEFPILSNILKEYKKLREQKPVNVMVIKKNIEKEDSKRIRSIAEEINNNAEYRKMVVSGNRANKKCIEELFHIGGTTASLVGNYLNNLLKETKTPLPEVRIKGQHRKIYEKKGSNVEIKLQENGDIMSRFLEDLEKEKKRIE